LLEGATASLLPLVSFASAWRRDRIREVDPEIILPGKEKLPPVAPEELPSPAKEPQPPAATDPPTLREVVADPGEERDTAADERGGVSPGPSLSPPPTVSTDVWTCEIALWREEGEAVFYARSFYQGVEIPLAESPPFPLVGDDVLEQSPAAMEAHRGLGRQLTDTGWLHVEHGPEWYGDRFQREFSLAALNASLKARLTYTRRP